MLRIQCWIDWSLLPENFGPWGETPWSSRDLVSSSEFSLTGNMTLDNDNYVNNKFNLYFGAVAYTRKNNRWFHTHYLFKWICPCNPQFLYTRQTFCQPRFPFTQSPPSRSQGHGRDLGVDIWAKMGQQFLILAPGGRSELCQERKKECEWIHEYLDMWIVTYQTEESLRSRGSQFTDEKEIKQIGRKVEMKEGEKGCGSFPGPGTSMLWYQCAQLFACSWALWDSLSPSNIFAFWVKVVRTSTLAIVTKVLNSAFFFYERRIIVRVKWYHVPEDTLRICLKCMGLLDDEDDHDEGSDEDGDDYCHTI